MTVARVGALGALLAAGVLVAILLLGGQKTHRYHVVFQNAGQLVKGNDVQIGGRRVGSINDIRLRDDNYAIIDFEIEKDFAPLYEGTRAAIRATSLSGIANRYVALQPAPARKGAELKDGATLDAAATTTVVDLDQLFNALDKDARTGLRRVIRGSGRQFQGRGVEANEAAKYFNPFLSSTRRLVNEVTRDQRALERFIVTGADTMTALAERRDDLTNLITNANNAAQGIAAENQAFDETLRRLPGTLRRANTTFVNLRSTLTDLDRLVAESKPATRRLAPFLRELRPLVRRAIPTIHDLRVLIRRPGRENDLIELTRKTPELARVARPALRNTTEALRKSTPVLDFIRPYAPELLGWFRDFGQGGANYDANGHYARIQPLYNLFSFTDNAAGGLLTPQDPDQRLEGLESGMLRRCPGAASQPAADGSAPWRDTDGDLDCDPRQVLSGP